VLAFAEVPLASRLDVGPNNFAHQGHLALALATVVEPFQIWKVCLRFGVQMQETEEELRNAVAAEEVDERRFGAAESAHWG